jgi:glycosyltransferase involved in cell wall biosynthesis
MKKLAIITTHPIQYNAPLFRLLTMRGNIEIKVFYTWSQSENEVYDPDFRHSRKWDIPLLEGYNYEFVTNTSTKPGSNRFKGIINPDIINRINSFTPSALLVFGWAFSTHFKLLRYYKGKIPVLFRGDSNLLDEPTGISIKKFLRRQFLRWVYSYVDKALYVGTYNKQYFLKHGLKEHQLIFTPHAVENDRFVKSEELSKEAKKMRENLLIEPDNTVFLFAGKLHEKKDPLLLISAFIELNDTQSHLVLVGNGELEKKIKYLTENCSNIHWLPFQNQSKMPMIYHLCNVFVLPSKGPGETWGLAVNEAMAAGKAILVSNRVGGSIDLVSNRENGYIFEARNKLQLVKRMKCLSEDKNFTVRMGELSRRKISHWSFNHVAKSIEVNV